MNMCLLMGLLMGMIAAMHGSIDAAQINCEPESINVTINSIASFECLFSQGMVIWSVNGTEISPEHELSSQGITYHTIYVDGVMKNSTLQIHATTDNNNTEVVCLVIPGPLASEVAYLRVQGLLDPPILTVSNISSTLIMLEWIEPFSLDITGQDPDIVGYMVHISGPNSTEILTVNVTDTQYVYESQAQINYCDTFEFTIAGINQAGIGNKSESIYATFERPKLVGNPTDVTVTAGEAAVFNCSVQCTAAIQWLINGTYYILSDQVAEVYRHQCNQMGYYTESLVVSTTQLCNSSTTSIECVSVSVYAEAGCIVSTCHSRKAYITVLGSWTNSTTAVTTSTLQTTTATKVPANDSATSVLPTYGPAKSSLVMIIGGSFGGVILVLILAIVTMFFVMWLCCANRKPTDCEASDSACPMTEEPIYDLPTSPLPAKDPQLLADTKPCVAYDLGKSYI